MEVSFYAQAQSIGSTWATHAASFVYDHPIPAALTVIALVGLTLCTKSLWRWKSKPLTPPELSLAAAAEQGDTLEIQALLERGVDRAAIDAHGFTPLHRAAYYGRTEAVRLVADKDLIDRPTHDERTPLMLAAAQGHQDTVQTLLDLGASPTAPNSQGATAFHVAAYNGHLRALKLVADPSLLEAATNDGRTALMLTLGQGHLDIGLYLLQSVPLKLGKAAEQYIATHLKDGARDLLGAALRGKGGGFQHEPRLIELQSTFRKTQVAGYFAIMHLFW